MKDILSYFWTTAQTRVWSHEKADNEASAKSKEVKGKPDKINELIPKTKADRKEGPDNIIVILGLFFLNWLVITWRRGFILKLDL